MAPSWTAHYHPFTPTQASDAPPVALLVLLMLLRLSPLARAACAAITVTAAACSDNDDPTGVSTAGRIDISTDTLFLDRGASQRLSPKLMGTGGQEISGASFIYTVADTDATGNLTARRGGVTSVRIASGAIDASVPVVVFGHPDGNKESSFSGLGLPGRPHGVSIARSGVFYVSQIGGSSVTKGSVSASAQSFAGSVTVGGGPAHVAINPAGTKAYSANQFANSASVIDVATNTVVATIPLAAEGYNVLTSPTGDRAYVTTSTGRVYVIDGTTNQLVTTLSVGGAANGLAYHGPSKTLYVSSLGAGTVTAINAQTNTITRTYPVSGMPQRIAVSRDGTEIYIASETVGLEILDVASGTRVTVPGVGSGAVGLALSPDQAEIWVTNPPLGRVYMVSRSTRTVLRGLVLTGGSPRNVTFDYHGRVALIADEAGGVVFVR
jgi:YVTN family beta-propeller protein